MKNLLLLFFFSCYSISLFAQDELPTYKYQTLEQVEYIATYSLKYHEDSLNPYDIRQEDMQLYLGKNISMFVSKRFAYFENKFRHMKSWSEVQKWLNSGSSDLKSMKSRFKYRIYKNYPTGKITVTDHVISSGSFKYEESEHLFNWVLTNDTSHISGYEVQKATCEFGGRKWVAWFSKSIPFSDGPYKFNGLPGLIVKIYDTKNQYIFQMTSFQKPKGTSYIEIALKPYIVTTKQNFFKAKDNARANIASIIKGAGLGKEAQQTATQKMSQRNNPIELKRK